MSCTLAINIPFVLGRCDYYGRPLHPDTPTAKKQAYLDALLGEARAVAGDLDGEVDELAFVNGSLSTIEPRFFHSFMRELSGAVPFAKDCYVSAEVDPGLVSSALIGELKMRGINMLRFHYLTSDAVESERLGLPSSSVEMSKTRIVMDSAGFETFDMQLLVGLSKQTEKTLLKSLRDAVLWDGVVHCTLIPASGPLAMGRDGAVELLDVAVAFLEEHGFVRYAPLCFAKEGFAIPLEKEQHTERSIVSLGPATTSQCGGYVWSNRGDLDAYIKAKGDPERITRMAVQLDEPSLRARALVGKLYRAEDLSASTLTAAESAALEELVDRGLLVSTAAGESGAEAGFQLTSCGCLAFDEVSRRIMQTLVE